MKTVLSRFWHSTTIMTWLSYSTRAITLFVVIPLVLSKFNSAEILLWFMFSTIISLQGIIDFGFRQIFTRIISYAYCGADSIADLRNNTTGLPEGSQPNKQLLNGIVSSMKRIYLFLTFLVLVLMIVFGTWALLKSMSEVPHPNEAWTSWIIIIIVTCITFYGKLYLNFLEGLNMINLARRVETVTFLCSIISSIAVMVWFPSVLHLVIANQFWLLVAVLRDWYLCRKIGNRIFVEVSSVLPFDKQLFNHIWQPSWRTGLSGLMSVGLTNLTGIIYAQFVNVQAAASYLLALRIINQVKEISMAPFYSKLPLLSMLRVRHELPLFISTVRRGMFLSHIVFVAGFILAGIFAEPLLKYLHSDVGFVSDPLWILLGIAFFIHRFGAMHIQVYLTTNHIISHIADGVSGVIIIVSTLAMIRYMGIYAIPIGMIVGYLVFYCWYAAINSYRSMKIKFVEFEWRSSFLPAILFIIYSISILITSHS